jgi:HTH-type transcriptional regulator/antitoxin HigA
MTTDAYPLKSIQTEADYGAALQLVAPYFENEPEFESDAGKHFEAMVALIQAYEAKHYPIAPTDQVVPTTASRRSNR